MKTITKLTYVEYVTSVWFLWPENSHMDVQCNGLYKKQLFLFKAFLAIIAFNLKGDASGK